MSSVRADEVDGEHLTRPSSSSSSAAAAAASTSGPMSKRQKVNHKPPPDALQHKFKPFVQAAFDMVSNPANWGAIRFNEDGTAVEIIDVSAFSDKVLPRYFKHKNISSFIRQMNMYGFEKIDGTEGAIHTFKHEFFKRDQPNLLVKILRKPVKAHRRPGEDDGDESVTELLEAKRVEAHQAVDELTRLKQAQQKHEDRLRALEQENAHLTEENQRIKGAIIQVKSAQQAMTDRLRRLFMYFMRYYVRDEKGFEDTIRNLLENANSASGDGSLQMSEPQRQVINSLFQLEDDPQNSSLLRLPSTDTIGNGMDDLTRNHSLTSPWDVQPIVLPSKPRLDDSLANSEYVNLARDLAQHIDQNDVALRRIDSLASELQDVDVLGDDLLDDPALARLPSTTSITGPLKDDDDDDDDTKLIRS